MKDGAETGGHARDGIGVAKKADGESVVTLSFSFILEDSPIFADAECGGGGVISGADNSSRTVYSPHEGLLTRHFGYFAVQFITESA